MAPPKHATIWVSALYFLVLLCIALWVRDIPGQPDALNNTLQQIAAGITRMSDPASFAIAAIDLAETGRISGANEWIFNLWPPGFIMMQALIMKVFGPEVPVILVLQIMAVVLFSTLLTLLYEYLKVTIQRIIFKNSKKRLDKVFHKKSKNAMAAMTAHP